MTNVLILQLNQSIKFETFLFIKMALVADSKIVVFLMSLLLYLYLFIYIIIYANNIYSEATSRVVNDFLNITYFCIFLCFLSFFYINIIKTNISLPISLNIASPKRVTALNFLITIKYRIERSK